MTDELTKKGIHDESFFCSELIVYAFYKGCLPIIRGGYQTATPGAVATSSYLTKIKDVVTVWLAYLLVGWQLYQYFFHVLLAQIVQILLQTKSSMGLFLLLHSGKSLISKNR